MKFCVFVVFFVLTVNTGQIRTVSSLARKPFKEKHIGWSRVAVDNVAGADHTSSKYLHLLPNDTHEKDRFRREVDSWTDVEKRWVPPEVRVDEVRQRLKMFSNRDRSGKRRDGNDQRRTSDRNQRRKKSGVQICSSSAIGDRFIQNQRFVTKLLLLRFPDNFIPRIALC